VVITGFARYPQVLSYIWELLELGIFTKIIFLIMITHLM